VSFKIVTAGFADSLGYCNVKGTELVEMFRRNHCLKLEHLLQKRTFLWENLLRYTILF